MQKITPHLWYDKEAKEAADFYISIFKDSRQKNITTIHNTPSGSVDIVTIELMGQEFTLISAGPLFKFNPSVSFLAAFDSAEAVDVAWEKLSEGGVALMELGPYPFAERYGWIQDMYGLSWQLMFRADSLIRQTITPTLMFVGKQCGRAEEAINLYVSVFNDAHVDGILNYGENEAPDKAGAIKHAAFTLEGQAFAAMDSARGHNFAFNEAISLIVHCDTQEEIDYYWDKLTAAPEAEQCGWLKDKFGLSWQIVPTVMDEMFSEKDEQYVEAFARYRSVPRILARFFSPSASAQFRNSIRVPTWRNITNAYQDTHVPWTVILLNTVAMAIWTVGVFSALYAAYLRPELRVTSSQLSAIINGVATILMFMFIDPYLSMLTDELVEGKVSDPYFRRSIVWLTGSRIVGTVMAQFLLIPAALWIVTVAEWL